MFDNSGWLNKIRKVKSHPFFHDLGVVQKGYLIENVEHESYFAHGNVYETFKVLNCLQNG